MAHDWIFLIAKPNSNTNEDIQTYSGSRSRSADRSVMRRKSGKYQTLLAQRDSLLTVEQKYDQTLEILNEIETGFQSIREVEDRVMTQISDIENKPLDKNNRWYRRSTKSRVSCSKQGANRRTRSTIRTKRPQERFAGRDDQTSAGRNDPESRTDRIASDRAVPKNIEIEELAGTVEELNKDIAGLNEVTASQKLRSRNRIVSSMSSGSASPI